MHSIAIIHPLDFTSSIIANLLLPIELTRMMELVAYKNIEQQTSVSKQLAILLLFGLPYFRKC
jgi:hypothetical protein